MIPFIGKSFARRKRSKSAIAGKINIQHGLFPGLDANTKPPLRLLWIACGTEDFLTAANRKFWDWLQARQVPFTKIETPGGHTWPVWRRNLAAFAPLLFR